MTDVMAKMIKLQDQLKLKNKEISNLKSNLAAQENLSKSYLNEIEQLTLQLNAKEAELGRSADVVDLLINQQRKRSGSLSLSTDDDELSDLLVRNDVKSSTEPLVEGVSTEVNNNNNKHVNVDTVARSHPCVLFFRYGEGECPGEDTCGRSHNPEILHKKGVCFKDFEKEGSCPRKDQCWFSHETPPELRVDASFKKFMAESKERSERKKSSQGSRNLSNSSNTNNSDATAQGMQNYRDDMSSNTGETGSNHSESSPYFLDQRQVIQLIQQQVQSSLSYFMSQICPQMGWNSMGIN